MAAVAFAAGFMGLPPSPASAQSLPGFICAEAPSGGNLTVCVKGVAQLIPVGAATAHVVVTCHAVVEGVVVTAGVGCQLNAVSGGAYGWGPNLWVPGSTSVTGFHTIEALPLQAYEICVGGNYLTSGGALGSDNGWAAFGCFSSIV